MTQVQVIDEGRAHVMFLNCSAVEDSGGVKLSFTQDITGVLKMMNTVTLLL